MEVLSKQRCAAWIAEDRLGPDADGWLLPHPMRFRGLFSVPDDATRQRAISCALSRWFGAEESLLWMTTWPIFTEPEMESFLAWRERLGASGRLIDKPGHLFPGGAGSSVLERAELMAVMLDLNWEGKLYQRGNRSFIWLADEIIDITTTDSSEYDTLQETLERHGLKWDELPIDSGPRPAG